MSDSTTADTTTPSPDTDGQAEIDKKVRAALHSGAYISAISTPAPGEHGVPIPMIWTDDARAIGGYQSDVWAHRFRVQEADVNGGRFLVTNATGGLHFNLVQRLTVVPDGYDPPAGSVFATLDRAKSQAINLSDAEFSFDEEGKNRFFGSATGRTGLQKTSDGQRLWFGANGEISHGVGLFEGLVGTYVINGEIGPDGPSFHVLIRLQDSSGQFVSQSEPKSFDTVVEPMSCSTFMTFVGNEDPESPVQQKFENGAMVGAHVTELLSASWLDFDTGRRNNSLRTFRRTGALMGKLETDIQFAPPLKPTSDPIPFATSGTQITFHDAHGTVVGTLLANIDQGQAVLMPLPGFAKPMPSFLIVGYGEITGGSGCFDGASGVMTVNSIISVFPAALMNMYVFRFNDAQHQLRAG